MIIVRRLYLQIFIMSRTFSIKCQRKDVSLQTPVCILHTRTGCIPHLTQETFSYLDPKLLPNVFEFSLGTVIDHVNTIKESGCSASECFCLPSNALTYCTVEDVLCKRNRGYNTKSTVAVWGSGGKISVSCEFYMKCIKAMKPNLFQVLADGDVEESDSRKRIVKSVDRSIRFLAECLEMHKESSELKDSEFLCMIEGGHLLEERKRCVELIHKHLEESQIEAWGYVLDSLPQNELLTDKWKLLVKSVTDILPYDKPVVVHGIGHPLNIIDLLECGVSIFDASYVTVLSENNKAFVFSFADVSVENGDIATVRPSIDDSRFNETICLLDSCYAQSFTPLFENCSCYTCTHHTKAYIHHLIVVNEMLAPVLLMLHNLHHFLSFFQVLRNEMETQSNLKTVRERILHLNQTANGK